MNKDWDLTDYYGEQKDLTRYRAGEPLPNNEPTCIAPWTTITLAANGVIKPCCVYVEKNAPSIHKGDTLETAWQQQEKLRERFLRNEKPDACLTCWKREAGAGNSRRQWLRDKIHNIPTKFDRSPVMQLRHMDLNFGNTCNLKCRMCGSWGSTHWLKEDEKLNNIDKNFLRSFRHTTKPTIIKGDYYKKNSKMFSTLERIDFKGGEPFMQDGMYEILQFLIDLDYAKNIIIGYSTNGTKTPESLKDLWPHFKRVVLNVSVEATGDLYGYIRGGNIQNISQLEKNIKWFDQFDNLKGQFTHCVSIYNVFDLQNLAEWTHEQTINAKNFRTLDPNRTSESLVSYVEPIQFDSFVVTPTYLDINNMPPHVKKIALQKWTKDYPILRKLRKQLSNEKYDKEQWELFKKFTIELDKMRNTDVKKVLPELVGEFNGIS